MAGRTVPAHHRCEFTCKGFLASAWGQRGSHQLAGRTGGEHVSAADPVTYPMGESSTGGGAHPVQGVDIDTGIRELHRRWGPPLSTISGLTRRQLPHTWWGVEGDRDDSCHGASNPTGGGAHHATKAEPHVRRSTSARIKTILFFLERCVMYTESLRGCPGFWVVLWGCGFAFLLWVGHGYGVSAVCSRLGPGLTWGLLMGKVRPAA